jgi:prepilin-type N-terminal cleavage/methylation domain-containing protein
MRLSNRKGFSMVELLVAMLLVAILGTAITRFLLTEIRLFALQRARREARAVSRSSTNVLFSDLRMVNDGASAPGSIVIASPETLKVRVPYAFGVSCGAVSGGTVASILPADSSVRYMASYAGYAWRRRAGGFYTYVPMADSTQRPAVSILSVNCGAVARIHVDTVNGSTWPVMDLKPAEPLAQPGAPVFLFQEVMYWFAQSEAYPQTGRIGLWRRATGGAAEELVAPFDATARFKFYTRNSDTPSLTAPAVLDSLVGVAIVLNGSTATATITKSPVKSAMETAVFFRNRRNP